MTNIWFPPEPICSAGGKYITQAHILTRGAYNLTRAQILTRANDMTVRDPLIVESKIHSKDSIFAGGGPARNTTPGTRKIHHHVFPFATYHDMLPIIIFSRSYSQRSCTVYLSHSALTPIVSSTPRISLGRAVLYLHRTTHSLPGVNCEVGPDTVTRFMGIPSIPLWWYTMTVG